MTQNRIIGVCKRRLELSRLNSQIIQLLNARNYYSSFCNVQLLYRITIMGVNNLHFKYYDYVFTVSGG